MISDFVKGKQQYNYPAAIQVGIKLHRSIDAFTDSHAATQELKQFFRPQYRLYAGAFADVVYDYFLANDTAHFADAATLQQFAVRTYATLTEYNTLLPPRFAAMLPYMQQQDWLSNYRHTWGIEKSFGGVVRRSAYLTESAIAYELFIANLPAMRKCYEAFMPSMMLFAANQLQVLVQD